MKPIKYDTYTFQDVWDEASEFKTDYKESPLYITGQCLTDGTGSTVDNITALYYLLYAKYGNSPIANFDVNQFKYKVYSIIYQYGPTWQKELEVQQTLRAMTEDDLQKGAKIVYNKAYNDATAPSTQAMEEIEYINEQNTSNYKRTKLDAYGNLINLLKRDVTNDFLLKFRPLFKKFVSPEVFPIYVSEEDDYE